MSVTLFNSGQKLRASRLNAMITYMTRISASKATDTSRNTTTTNTADPDLVLPLAANTSYDVHLMLILTSAANAAGDFKAELQFPSGATCSFVPHGLIDTLASGSSGDLQAGSVSLDTSSPTGSFSAGVSTSATGVLITARVTTVSAGDLTLAWSQLASNANNTTLKGGSTMTAVPAG